MTATSPIKRRRRFRLASMESLGFFDSPYDSSVKQVVTSTTRLVTTMPAETTGNHVTDLWESTELHAPSLADWVPQRAAKHLKLRRNFRWSMLLGLFLLLAGVSGIAYWIYQRPAEVAADATAAVVADAGALNEALSGVSAVAEGLNGTIPAGYVDTLNRSDEAARALFARSADLPETEIATRSAAADAAGLAAEASRSLGDAAAFRTALEPVLIVPAFETDPDLIDLTTATAEFGTWWAQMDRVGAALPQGVSAETITSFDSIRNEFETVQGAYIDALRLGDGATAAEILTHLQAELDGVRAELTAAMDSIASTATDQLTKAEAVLADLLG